VLCRLSSHSHPTSSRSKQAKLDVFDALKKAESAKKPAASQLFTDVYDKEPGKKPSLSVFAFPLPRPFLFF
jgi:hypothetical protein